MAGVALPSPPVDARIPGEDVARRWATIAVVVAVAGVVMSVVALATGIGVLLAVAAVVVALWVRLGLAPYARRPAAVALVVAGVTLAAHLVLYTGTLLS